MSTYSTISALSPEGLLGRSPACSSCRTTPLLATGTSSPRDSVASADWASADPDLGAGPWRPCWPPGTAGMSRLLSPAPPPAPAGGDVDLPGGVPGVPSGVVAERVQHSIDVGGGAVPGHFGQGHAEGAGVGDRGDGEAGADGGGDPLQ